MRKNVRRLALFSGVNIFQIISMEEKKSGQNSVKMYFQMVDFLEKGVSIVV